MINVGTSIKWQIEVSTKTSLPSEMGLWEQRACMGEVARELAKKSNFIIKKGVSVQSMDGLFSARSKPICPHQYVNQLQACFMSCSKLFCLLLASFIETRSMSNVIFCIAVLWCHTNQHGNIYLKMLIVILLRWWLDYCEMCFVDGHLFIFIDMVHKLHW